MSEKIQLQTSKLLHFSLSLLIGILYFSSFSIFRASGRWDIISIPAMSPEFGDLKAVTSAVDCTNRLDFIDSYTTNCDYWGRPFNYPTIWVHIFRFFNLGSSSTSSVGIVFLVLTSLFISFWGFYSLRSRITTLKMVVMGGVLFSPSFYLLNERGNVDIVIFCLISLSLWLYLRNHELIAVVIIVFATMLKVFPIALLLSILLFTKKNSTRVFAIVGIIVAILYLRPFMSLISSNTPISFDYSFGFYKIAIPFLSSVDNQNLIVLYTTLVFLSFVMIGIFVLLFSSKIHSFMQISQLSLAEKQVNQLFLLTWPIFLSVYVTMTSFNYRLVFTLPMIAILLRQNTRVSDYSSILFMVYCVFAMRLGSTSIALDVVLFVACLLTSIIWLFLFQINIRNRRTVSHKWNFIGKFGGIRHS